MKNNAYSIDAERLREAGYDEEDIAMMKDPVFWEEIQVSEAEEDFVVWHRGMFGGLKSRGGRF